MRVAPAIALAILLSAPLPAWSRAGGGQSYSGGSHSSSSFGSSRSSSSSSSFGSSRSSSGFGSSHHSYGGSYSYSSSSSSSGDGRALLFLLLLIGIPVAVVIALHIFSEAAASSASDDTAGALQEAWARRRARSMQPEDDRNQGLTQIRARDPSFEPTQFLLCARKAFVEIQHAWTNGDFAAAHRLVSDGVLRRFSAQLALNDRFDKRNATTDLQVRESVIAAVESDSQFDTLHVRFRAALRDCDVPATYPLNEALAEAAQAPLTEFTEVWSFVRRLNPGARQGTLAEGKCPHCGAPVMRAPSATCGQCNAVLNSGAYDWVLSEITQEEEFEFHPARAVPGLADLQRQDPALNRQVLEDRASLVFWKWIEASATGTPATFERLCTPAEFTKFRQGAPRSLGGLDQCAVGSVELVAIDSDAQVQRAHLSIRWSTSGAGTGIVRKNVLALERSASVKTNPSFGLATDRCHHCGASQTQREAVRCEYCQALLSQDWAFAGLVSQEAFEARRRVAAPAPAAQGRNLGGLEVPQERERMLAAMAALMQSDGYVSVRERKLLDSYAQRWAIPLKTVAGLLATPPEQLLDLKPADPEEAKELYRALWAAAFADGRVDTQERRMLDKVAFHLRLSQADQTEIARAAAQAASAA